MNYLDYIQDDNREIDELKSLFKSEYPDHEYLMAESTSSENYRYRFGFTSGVNILVEMYLIAYIYKNKPMTVLEYGSGKTTYIMSTVMKDLNYGGKVISFEDSENWFIQNEDKGLYEGSEVHLVSTILGSRVEDDPTWDTEDEKKYVYYDHDFSEIDSVDFILSDGPTLSDGATYCNNWYMATEYFEKPFDLLVEGRSGERERLQYLYPNKTKISRLGVHENVKHIEKFGKCGIGTKIGKE